MHHDFWYSRWQTNQIGFHLSETNPLLVKHFPALNLPQGAHVFLPLCGKSLDIHWLLAQGFCIVGVELSQIAVEALFADLKLSPTVRKVGALTRYSANNIEIFNGDFFALSAQILGKVDAIYDRAALVALPEDMRKRYTAHLMAITQKAMQLLICFEYDQTIHAGPPFSISKVEVNEHYHNIYAVQLLASHMMADGLKGKFPATEMVLQLTPLHKIT